MNKHERAGAFAKKAFPLLGAMAIGVLAGATIVNERYQLWQLSDDYTVRLPPGETPDNICKQLAAAEARAGRALDKYRAALEQLQAARDKEPETLDQFSTLLRLNAMRDALMDGGESRPALK